MQVSPQKMLCGPLLNFFVVDVLKMTRVGPSSMRDPLILPYVAIYTSHDNVLGINNFPNLEGTYVSGDDFLCL